jgi:eukaryotic-like serine/threonine-protein kinase
MNNNEPEGGTLDRWIGRRVGAYEIVALIGSGGMGEVYRARRIDAQYEKEVAIKLVPSAAAAKFILQRLRAERQILAKLDHPHIARLIDGGVTEEGLPYLIMDLVDGEPLDRYCEQRKLRVRERLRLFRDVCSAVSYAHQHLVVHRDLKPNNILVTSDGTVKLLDFGIAKLLQPDVAQDVAAPTITGMSTATPEFASPEQLLGKPITTASDVYSLGIVLYLLLTRQLPYRSTPESLHELIREVVETEPPRPSTKVAAATARHGDRVDADLDAITLRALRKEPEKRYRSVEEFSEDIRRYLDAMPVMARDGQLAYRTAKFLRRRKLEVTAAVLIVGMLVGGIVSSVRQAYLADEQRARAEHHFASVRDLAEVSMFQLHDAIKDLPGATAARQLLVNTALEYLNALASEAGHDRSLQHDLASAYAKVADIQGKAWHANTGKPEEAINSYAKAIALLEPLVAADPADSAARHALAQSYLQQSRLLILLGDPKKSAALSQKATDMFEALAAANPTVKARAAFADAARVHGQNLSATEGKNAVMYSYKAIEIMEDLHRQHPSDLELEFALGMAYDTAGGVVQHGDERQETKERATALHLKALVIDEHLVAVTGGRNASYVRSLLADRVNLCSQYYDQRNFLRAVDHCRAAQPLVARLRSDQTNAQIALDSAALEWNLGAALLGAGRLSEATKTFSDNVRALEAIIKETDTIQTKYLLAACEQGLGTIQMQLALRAGASRAERLRRWRLAREWYEKSVARFAAITAQMELVYPDSVPIDKAIAGLARSKEEIARLEGDDT